MARDDGTSEPDWFDTQADEDGGPENNPDPTPPPTTPAPTTPAPTQAASTPDPNAERDPYREKIRQALIKGYGYADPKQIDYYVERRNTAVAEGDPRDDNYWSQRAMGWQAGGADAAKFGPYAGGEPMGAIPGAYQLPGGFEMGMFTGGGKYPLNSVMAPGLLAGFNAPFQNPGNFRTPGDFNRPTPADMLADPGYQARLAEGNQQIERAAAAKGTIRNPGTLKDLMQWGQDYATNEYGKTYDRAFNENNQAYNRAFNENNTDYNRAWNEYMGAYNIFDRNQGNQFNRLSGVAGMGQNAANSMGNYNSGVASRTGNMLTDYGSAQANATNANQANRNTVTGTTGTDVGGLVNTGIDIAKKYLT